MIRNPPIIATPGMSGSDGFGPKAARDAASRALSCLSSNSLHGSEESFGTC